MDQLPLTSALETELTDGWLSVWFNQPERRNPLTDAVVSDLLMLCTHLSQRFDIRGVSLRGRGGYFCAGGDLREFRAMADAPRGDTLEASARIGRLLAAVDALPQVTLAVIEGAAMAGGLGLACSCDVTVGTADAAFGFSETRIGITPAQIAPYVVRKAGYANGRRLMLTGARFKGAVAAELGLLDLCVDQVEALEATVLSIKADVLNCSPAAVGACKSLLRALPDLKGDAQILAAAENFTDCLQGPSGREGVAAFLEKRSPEWATGSH